MTSNSQYENIVYYFFCHIFRSSYENILSVDADADADAEQSSENRFQRVHTTLLFIICIIVYQIQQPLQKQLHTRLNNRKKSSTLKLHKRIVSS